MAIEEALKARIRELIEQGETLKETGSSGRARDAQHLESCTAWFVPVLHVIDIICPDFTNAYRIQASSIAGGLKGLSIPSRVGALVQILSHLLIDVETGLISAVSDAVRAETFDDFLDHAEAYRREQRKEPAGVIAGVVFEDTVRRICRRNGIPDKGGKLEDLINTLARKGLISGLKAKQGKAAAHVRTKATHAQWDEIDLGGVKATIDLARELISKHLC